MTFLEELRMQRWDDHRYYHHSKINQSLHFVSACSFLAAYAYLLVDPVRAAFLGWVVAMVTRQSGHFFFEPKGYDEVNQATHEHKEEIKVGYNLRRKVVLHVVWALIPVLIYFNPTVFGLMEMPQDWNGYAYNLAVAWIVLGAAALLFRTVHLFFIMGVQSGLVWFTKILTDPFHDIKLYHRAPLALFRRNRDEPELRHP